MTVISLEGLLLTLACALGWALLDITRKFLASGASAVATAFLLVSGQIPLFIAWAWLDLGEGSAFELIPAAAYWPAGFSSMALNLLANIAFMQSVKLSPMSRTVPLLSLTPVFTTLIAIPIFAEWPSAWQASGIVAVVLSSIVIARDSSGEGVGGLSLESLGHRGGLLMALVALLWSVTPNLDKLALRHASPAIHALFIVTGAGSGLALLAWRRGRGGDISALLKSRRAIGLVACSVALAAFSVGVQFLAYEHVAVGLVETIKRGFGASFALFAGWLLWSEQIGFRRLLAAAIMTAGVAVVIMG